MTVQLNFIQLDFSINGYFKTYFCFSIFIPIAYVSVYYISIEAGVTCLPPVYSLHHVHKNDLTCLIDTHSDLISIKYRLSTVLIITITRLPPLKTNRHLKNTSIFLIFIHFILSRHDFRYALLLYTATIEKVRVLLLSLKFMCHHR